MGGKLGNEYKGMNVFVDSLPTLCGKLKLTVIVIKYSKPKARFEINARRQRILGKYCRSKHVKIVRGKRNAARIMALTRFSFFPNIKDCSPLLISESLVRGKPVLVNKRILGGWKYVNDDTGALFTIDSIEEKANYIMEGNFNTRDSYMNEYGYKNTSTRMAIFCTKYIPLLRDYSMIGFVSTGHVMGAVNGRK